jgi:hypothetical protein
MGQVKHQHEEFLVTNDVSVILTMDCEPALFELSSLAIQLSGSGPATYEQG